MRRRWENGVVETKLVKRTVLGMSLRPSKMTTILVRKRGQQNGWDERKLGHMWQILRQDLDLEDPTPSLDRTYLGCTQGEAEVDHEGVRSTADLFRRITTEVTNQNSSQPITAWTTWKDMPKARVEWVMRVMLLEKNSPALKLAETSCMDDHQFSVNIGELAPICAWIVM